MTTKTSSDMGRVVIEKEEALTEQCLAEASAKAIGDMQLKLTPYTIDGNAYYRAGDIAMYKRQVFNKN